MEKRTAFTLIELLVVIAIIALLVSILVPSLTRATAMARKATCSAKMSAQGKAVAMFVFQNEHYPLFAPVPWDVPLFQILDYPEDGDWDWDHAAAWPKTYGVLESMDIQGTHRTTLNWWAYFWEADEIWDGVLCDAMDAPAILQWCDGAPQFTDTRWKIDYHRAAIGYQWNFRLRGPCQNGLRWTAKLDTRGEPLTPGGPCLCQNVPWGIYLPNDSTKYAAQAVNPEEVVTPAKCAEAWDSPDFGTLDWITETRDWRVDSLMPGFYVGPQMLGTNGLAVLPGSRHIGSPNILYADGHVAADATRKIDPNDPDHLGECPVGTWDSLNAYTWQEHSPTFGTIHYILPDPSF